MPARSSLPRPFVLALALVSLLVAAPAHATPPERFSGRVAEASWTRYDGDLAHIHTLSAFETAEGHADVFLIIATYRCGDTCAFVRERMGDGTALAFELDKQLRDARLDGRVTLHRPDGSVVNRRLQLAWSDAGPMFRDRRTYRYHVDGDTAAQTERSRIRITELTGSFGAHDVTTGGASGILSSFASTSSGGVP